jgi:acetyl esterase/lipase
MHPDHLYDVQAGIRYLQGRFRFQDRYVLVGHSCGATLAFQTTIEQALSDENITKSTVPPQAIVGVAGIYDLVLLRDMDPYPPSCQYFLSQAFGTDEQVWKRASPVKGDYMRNWPEGRVTILVKCSEDEYVSPVQLDVMGNALESWWKQDGKNLEIHTVYGAHDDCWKLGAGLVFGINRALAYLMTEKQDVVA